MAGPDPHVEMIRGVLVRLRTRTGLSVERLRSTEVDIQPITDLPVVRHHVQATGADSVEAVVHTLRQLASRLEPTYLLIADTALALGLLRDRIPGKVGADQLYAVDLGDRRTQLVALWSNLHTLLGVHETPAVPTVRALRTTLEQQALGRLAELCVTTVHLAEPIPDAARQTRRAGRPTVMIVGAAVMDRILAVDRIPTTGTSAEASSSVEGPGGKGLNQAVACARLGLEVELLAPVGDDTAGDTIIDYLKREGVPTRGIKQIGSASTPTAHVLITPTGDSAVVGWSNETQVRLELDDLTNKAARAAMRDADAVILTFEPTQEAVRAVLETMRERRPHPGLFIVHPSPPRPNPQLLYEYFSSIDYVIGAPWELQQLLPEPDSPESTVEGVATQLLVHGVGGVCIIDHFSCILRGAKLNTEQPRFPTLLSDTPGARDAFVGAFTYRVLKAGGNPTKDVLTYATAAMAAATSFGAIPDSMPYPEQIDRVLNVPNQETSRR